MRQTGLPLGEIVATGIWPFASLYFSMNASLVLPMKVFINLQVLWVELKGRLWFLFQVNKYMRKLLYVSLSG